MKKIIRLRKFVLTFVVGFSLLLSGYIFNQVTAADSDNLEVSINTTTANVNTGDLIDLNVAFAFNSNVGALENAVLEITIPNALLAETITPGTMPMVYEDNTVEAITPVVSGNTITYTTAPDKPIKTGYTGTIDLINVSTTTFATIPQAVTFNAALSADVSGAVETATDTVDVNLVVNPTWNLTKDSQRDAYSEGDYIKYTLNVNAPEQSANLSALSFDIVDILPAGVQFVAFDSPDDSNITTIYPGFNMGDTSTWGTARVQPYSADEINYPAGSVNENNGTIQWTIPDVGISYNQDADLEVSFWAQVDSGILGSQSEMNITNNVTMNTHLIDGSQKQFNGTRTIQIVSEAPGNDNVPNKLIYFDGYGKDSKIIAFRLDKGMFINNSLTPLMNYTVSDSNWSDFLSLKVIDVKTMTTGVSSMPYFSYTVNFYNGATLLSSTSATTQTRRGFTAPAGSTSYKIVFDQIPAGSGRGNASLEDVIVSFDVDSDLIQDATCVFNEAIFSYTQDGNEQSSTIDTGCLPLLENGKTILDIIKYQDSSKPFFQYGDTVTYTVAIGDDTLTGVDGEDIMIYDLMPKGIRFVPDSLEEANPGDVTFVSITENYKGTGRQMVVWEYNPDLVGTNHVTKFKGYVTAQAVSGTAINNIYMMSSTPFLDSDRLENTLKDVDDLNNNGNTDEPVADSSAPTIISGNTGLAIVKEVKGDMDSEWTQYPSVGNVSAGGQFSYRITVTNYSQTAMNNVDMIDILPHIGDTGVILDDARNSTWNPSLKGALNAPPGVQVGYSTSTNPSRADLGLPLMGDIFTDFQATVPDDVTSVKSLKIHYDGPLQPNESFTLTYDMVSPVGVPNNGEAAWNSIGAQATKADNVRTLAIEPKAVGMETQPNGLGSISGSAFNDHNRDGNKDLGDEALNGVSVYLLDGDGNPILDTNGQPLYTVTANDYNGNPGKYTFVNLVSGEYRVKFQPINGYGKTPSTGLLNPTAPDMSDYDLSTMQTNPITIANNNSVSNIDGGFTLGAIGDTVWNDENFNGLQDPGELGMEGIAVELLQGEVVIDEALTDSNGNYLFTNVKSGSYQVRITKPSNFNFTLKNIGTDRERDSDFLAISQNVGVSDVFNITDENGINQLNSTIDAGLYQGSSSLSGLVWNDMNRDNVYTSATSRAISEEPVMADVNLSLYDMEGHFVLATVTGANGKYTFANVYPGTYEVRIDVPKGYELVEEMFGSDQTINSKFLRSTNRTGTITVPADTEVENINAGLFMLPSDISGRIWLDTDENGLQDEGEPHVADAKLQLLDEGMNVIKETQSDENGQYMFDNLNAGNYVVEIVVPDKHQLTKVNVGDGVKLGSVFDLDTHHSAKLELPADGHILHIDGGLVKNADVVEPPTKRITENKVEPTPTGDITNQNALLVLFFVATGLLSICIYRFKHTKKE